MSSVVPELPYLKYWWLFLLESWNLIKILQTSREGCKGERHSNRSHQKWSKKIHKVELDDRRLKVREQRWHTLKKCCISHIDQFGYESSARWVLRYVCLHWNKKTVSWGSSVWRSLRDVMASVSWCNFHFFLVESSKRKNNSLWILCERVREI